MKHVAAAVIDYEIKANTAGVDYLPELRKFFQQNYRKDLEFAVAPTPLVS